MLQKILAVLAMLGAFWLAAASGAQEKPDKLDEEAKAVAEEFTKSFLVEMNVDNVMKVVAVPFYIRKDKIDDVHKFDDVRKHFSAVLAKKPQAIKGLAIKKVTSCEKMLTDKKIEGEMREVLEKGMKKTDRIVDMRTPVRDDGGYAEVTILVAWRDGKVKVVGYGKGFAGSTKGKK